MEPFIPLIIVGSIILLLTILLVAGLILLEVIEGPSRAEKKRYQALEQERLKNTNNKMKKEN